MRRIIVFYIVTVLLFGMAIKLNTQVKPKSKIKASAGLLPEYLLKSGYRVDLTGSNSALPQPVQTIIYRLSTTMGLDNKSLSVIVLQDLGINAFAGDNTIFITTGLLEYGYINSPDFRSIVFTLAHEMGHLVTIPTQAIDEGVSKRNFERTADYIGIALMYNAGYDCKDGVKRAYVYNKYGIDAWTHPPKQERLDSTIKNCNALMTTGELPEELYYE